MSIGRDGVESAAAPVKKIWKSWRIGASKEITLKTIENTRAKPYASRLGWVFVPNHVKLLMNFLVSPTWQMSPVGFIRHAAHYMLWPCIRENCGSRFSQHSYGICIISPYSKQCIVLNLTSHNICLSVGIRSKWSEVQNHGPNLWMMPSTLSLSPQMYLIQGLYITLKDTSYIFNDLIWCLNS